jgi:lipopolysaccharide export system protein LptA
MNLRRAVLAFAALCMAGSVLAQTHARESDPLGKFSDIPIDIAAERLDASGELATASGNVQISYGSTTIYSDQAQYDPKTRDVIASGDVRIYRDGQLFTAERAVYNLESKDIFAASVHGDTGPFLFSGGSFQNIPGTTGYLVKEGLFTTSDSIRPDWSLRARRIRIYRNDHIVLTDVKVYVGEVPVLWLPYVYQSLNRQDGFNFTPGFNSAWGGYVLTDYTFPISNHVGATLRLDYRYLRGPAVGLGVNWSPKDDTVKNWGRFTAYGLYDLNPGINKTGLAREPIDPRRYRVSSQARQYVTEDIYASLDINKLSDTRFLQDFYPAEFRRNPNPDNIFSLTKFSDDYTITALARKQINEFFDGTERLPEGALDFTRRPLFRSKVFYEGETSAGYYNRHFASGSGFQDYAFARLDSFHQFLMPNTFFGWLSVVPRVGVRGTWYTQSGGVGTLANPATAVLGGTASSTSTNPSSGLGDKGDLFRPAFNTGVEASLKASKVFEGVQSRAWGLDGLRHIVQPYANLSFVQASNNTLDIRQIDRLDSSTQLPPIDFPGFNSTDAIQDWNILRLGLRNRLQTRRNASTFNWLEAESFFDVRFDRPYFGGVIADTGRYSNIVNRVRWNPVPWASFGVEAQIPAIDAGFTEFNSYAYFMVNENARLTVSHQYLGENALFTQSSLLNVGGYLRFNDNWAFSAHESYEFRDHILQRQRYELHRDLSSWVLSLAFVALNNTSSTKAQNDYGVLLTLTLKDLPDIRLPVSFDPTGLSGSSDNGTGKNR